MLVLRQGNEWLACTTASVPVLLSLLAQEAQKRVHQCGSHVNQHKGSSQCCFPCGIILMCALEDGHSWCVTSLVGGVFMYCFISLTNRWQCGAASLRSNHFCPLQLHVRHMGLHTHIYGAHSSSTCMKVCFHCQLTLSRQ